MGVPQYTTPTFTLTFSDIEIDFTQMHSVYVSIQSRGKTMHKTGDDLDVEEHSIGVRLTQEETGALPVGRIAVQANWTDAEGNRAASEIAYVDISGNLLRRVIE